MSKDVANKIKVFGNRVLLERLEEAETTAGGIIIPDNAKEKSTKAKVIAVGTGKVYDDGKELSIPLKEGDIVLINAKWGANDIKLFNGEYVVVSFDDIVMQIL